MPIGLAQDPNVDLDRLDAGAQSLPVPQSARYGEEFGHFDFTRRAAQFGQHLIADTFGVDPADPQNLDLDQRLPADVANERYGVDGYLRFNQPTTPDDAAWLAAQAHERRFRDVVLSRTRPTPLRDFGASLAGSLLDPTGLAVMFATDGVATPAIDALGATRAAGAVGEAVSKLGRVGNLTFEGAGQLAKGAALNAPYVGLDAALSNYAGDDFTKGDALTDIAAGAIFHTGMHFGGRAISALLGRAPDAAAPGETAPASSGLQGGAGAGPADVRYGGTPPDAVTALPVESRAGAFAKAIDDLADDRPVDVGQYVAHELQPRGLSRLDEVTAEPAVGSFRPLDEATAITTRGTEVPVRYGLAELGDLTTSHDDHLSPNPDFPPELQPRDRGRAGAQARNYQLEAELNPKLLMNDVSAGGGAPIVAPNGVVESGNGRTIALRRSAAKGGDAYRAYRAELEARGFDTSGMKAPALVRMRTEPMEGAQRAALAREMNADVTERMSATEQAMTDAARLDPVLQAFPDVARLSDRDFTRAFIDRVAPDQVASFVDKDGRLSPEGERRMRAAMLARAYGDSRLVGQMFEGEEAAGRKIAEGLSEAAPAWAKMRSMAQAGEIPPALDLTAAVTSAMDLVRYAKQEGIGLGELLAERLGQRELFGGEAISPATEAFLRLFYRDEQFKRPQTPEKVTAALKDYARQAMAVEPGRNLFGEIPDEGTARSILGVVADKFARNDPGKIDLRQPGRAASPEPKPVVLDLRQLGGERDGAGGGLSPQAGGGAEGQGAAHPVADATEASQRLTAAGLDVNVSGDGPHGPVLEGLDGRFSQAVEALKLLQNGDARGVLEHPDVGAIDVIWGDETGGLAHILAKHADVLPDLPSKLAKMQVAKRTENRVNLRSESGTRAVVRLDYDGQAKTWLLTAFDEDRPGGERTETAPSSGPDHSPGRSADGNITQDGARAKPLTGEQLIAADPELKALAESTDQLAARNGIELAATPENQNPNTLAEAIRAAAVCLIGEMG